MPNRHFIQRSAALFAIKHTFRLLRKANGFYFLVDNKGAELDTPAVGGDTAAGAIRMMRRHVRLGLSWARADAPRPIVVQSIPAAEYLAANA